MTQQLVMILPQVQAFLQKEHGLLIEGKAQPAQSGKRLEVRNPATGEVIATVASADAVDVDAAVRSAHHAFTSGAWSAKRPAERERILLKLADILEQHAEELAQLETLNQGKSLHIARAIEVGASLEYVRYMAGWATKLQGETLDVSIPMPPGTRYNASTRREPIGVVAGIVPWNFPLMIAIWKLIPALAAGCTVVLKPSPETPLTALRLGELALQAGIPAGVVNIVTGDGAQAGQALTTHPLVSKISFTGSTATGKQVGHAAVENMTRFTLELGGKNPLIVLADADVDKTVQAILMAGFLNQGQVCAAASRLYIHRSKFQKIMEGVADVANSMTLGAGMDLQAQINPLVSARQQQSVTRLIDAGLSQGAKMLAGGDASGLPGYFIKPTVIVDVDHRNTLMRDEVFGPVLAAMPFDTEEQVLQLANDSRYGLAASLWTNDLSAAMRIVPRIEAGTVWVNSHIPLDPNLPFGGYKQSGMGREFGKHAVEACTELKSVCIAY